MILLKNRRKLVPELRNNTNTPFRTNRSDNNDESPIISETVLQISKKKSEPTKKAAKQNKQPIKLVESKILKILMARYSSMVEPPQIDIQNKSTNSIDADTPSQPPKKLVESKFLSTPMTRYSIIASKTLQTDKQEQSDNVPIKKDVFKQLMMETQKEYEHIDDPRLKKEIQRIMERFGKIILNGESLSDPDSTSRPDSRSLCEARNNKSPKRNFLEKPDFMPYVPISPESINQSFETIQDWQSDLDSIHTDSATDYANSTNEPYSLESRKIEKLLKIDTRAAYIPKDDIQMSIEQFQDYFNDMGSVKSNSMMSIGSTRLDTGEEGNDQISPFKRLESPRSPYRSPDRQFPRLGIPPKSPDRSLGAICDSRLYSISPRTPQETFCRSPTLTNNSIDECRSPHSEHSIESVTNKSVRYDMQGKIVIPPRLESSLEKNVKNVTISAMSYKSSNSDYSIELGKNVQGKMSIPLVGSSAMSYRSSNSDYSMEHGKNADLRKDMQQCKIPPRNESSHIINRVPTQKMPCESDNGRISQVRFLKKVMNGKYPSSSKAGSCESSKSPSVQNLPSCVRSNQLMIPTNNHSSNSQTADKNLKMNTLPCCEDEYFDYADVLDWMGPFLDPPYNLPW
jgi:hypothetical protein